LRGKISSDTGSVGSRLPRALLCVEQQASVNREGRKRSALWIYDRGADEHEGFMGFLPKYGWNYVTFLFETSLGKNIIIRLEHSFIWYSLV
jgi:hypothetical protein